MSETMADFLDLVREAFAAQDAWDQWDEGMTFHPWEGKRECTLDEVDQELDEANRKLIEFVVANQKELLGTKP